LSWKTHSLHLLPQAKQRGKRKMKRETTDRKKENIEANQETTCMLFNKSQLINVFKRAGYSFLLHFTKLDLILSHFDIISSTAPMPSKCLFDSYIPTTHRIFRVCQVLYHFSLCGAQQRGISCCCNVTTLPNFLLFRSKYPSHLKLN
jgi:hypothetical protein